jgi:transcriptional regulator with XRE-family HTH domain
MRSLAEVGQALQQARLQKRLSQEELAQRAGVSRVTLSRMETAAKGDMSLAALLRLARALGHELRLVERGHQRTLSGVLAEQRQDRGMQDVRNPNSTVSLAPVIKKAGFSDYDKPTPAPRTGESPLLAKRRSSPRVRKRKKELHG